MKSTNFIKKLIKEEAIAISERKGCSHWTFEKEKRSRSWTSKAWEIITLSFEIRNIFKCIFLIYLLIWKPKKKSKISLEY